MGMWLGDGTSRKPAITNIDPEVIDYLETKALQWGLELKQEQDITYRYSCSKHNGDNRVVTSLREYKLFTEKNEDRRERFIPEDFLRTDIKNRLRLLAGLIDSDGHLTKDKKYYEYCSKDVQLAEDVVWLSRSLGLKTSIKDKIVNEVVYKRVFITGPIHRVPVLIERKKAPNNIGDNTKHWYTTKIDIKPTKKDRYYGITIDQDHLYLLKDFTITHNTADLMLFEEAGKWPNLIDSFAVTSPVFRDGSIMTGMPIIFGTGGDMEMGSVDFAEMFYNPSTYWLRSYENVWDEGGYGTSCGLFIDDMWYKPGKVLIPSYLEKEYQMVAPPLEEVNKYQEKHPEDMIIIDAVDAEGNSHRCAAEIALERERASKKDGATKRSWEKYITRYPKTPKEAFLRTSGNVFPTVELNAWLGELEINKKAQAAGMTGDLYWQGDEVKWTPNMELYPVEKFPHKPDEDNSGCVVIWEHPYRNENGEIPYGMYIGGTDPYDQDKSTTSSLGSTFIYKTFTQFDQTYNMIVAEYTGRPDLASTNYEITRKLLEYYNAKTLYENQVKGLKIHFEQKKCLYLLKEQPSIIADLVKNSKVQRGYGIHMTAGIKTQSEIYLRDWLLEPRGEKEDGTKLMNLHTIYSVPLLQELIAYDSKHGNFDRVISFMVTILHSHENHKIKVDAEYTQNSKLNTGIFAANKVLFKKGRR